VLYSIDSAVTKITNIPHEKDYRRWRDLLNDDEYSAIQAALRAMIQGGEIHTSSWMPGSDRSETPFESIYTKACNYDEVASALCFGAFRLDRYARTSR
jgi:hypothetical protein